MPAMRISILHRLFLGFVLCLTAQHSVAAPAIYHHGVTVADDGKRSLQLTNDSDVPITAFVVMEVSPAGKEDRAFFDIYTAPDSSLPVPPGSSFTRKLSSLFSGTDLSKVSAEVPAVIFKDGSSAGDPVWINTILARRVRLHDRFLSLHDLLSPLVGTGISSGAIAKKLRTSLTGTVKQLPDDDLRAVDTMAFFDATSRFDREERQARAERPLRLYLKYLETRVLVLEYSRPDLDTIRTLPLSIPKRSSESGPPIAK